MAPPQWAYQVENFVSEPDEELVCSICRAVFCEPVMCPCDHVFCRACITKWIQNSRNCPICRKRVSHSSVKHTVPIVKNIIMKLMLNCHNKAFGCTAQFSVESSESHIKECEYELVQCKNKPCKEKLFRKDISEHETSYCPHRYIKCKTCGLKMSTSVLPERHNCIRALQLRLRRKNNMIRKKNDKIKELRNEIKVLKSASQGSEQSLANASHAFARLAAGLSPEEIMINITEFESSSPSITSLSSDESDDDIMIFTNSSAEADNTRPDPIFSFLGENNSTIEFRQGDFSPEICELRNAGSQTTNSAWMQSPSEAHIDFESSISSEAAADHGESSQSRRPGKRRPTTQKPAKRRFALAANSSDIECDTEPGPSRDRAILCIDGTLRYPHESDDSDCRCETCSQIDADLIANETSNAVAPSRNAVFETSNAPSRNAVFERTLSLLDQYNLESDPEWLPEYASHRGDTTSDTSTSCDDSEFLSESSSSLVSDHEDNSNSSRLAQLFSWPFDNTSEDDDPDWNPLGI